MLGRHKLICGDAREAGVYAALLGDEIIDLICSDPPYNAPIDGHGCGSGRIRHRNFAMGVGEMNKDQFTRFLVDTLGLGAARCRDGAPLPSAQVFLLPRDRRERQSKGDS
jgi:hypothetical protein